MKITSDQSLITNGVMSTGALLMVPGLRWIIAAVLTLHLLLWGCGWAIQKGWLKL